MGVGAAGLGDAPKGASSGRSLGGLRRKRDGPDPGIKETELNLGAAELACHLPKVEAWVRDAPVSPSIKWG